MSRSLVNDDPPQTQHINDFFYAHYHISKYF